MRRRIYDKGISPVIATVLLIGMVLIIGLIIFGWLRGIAQESVTKAGKNAELVCEEVDLEASYSSNILAITNIGNIPVFKISVKSVSVGGFETSDLDVLSDEWPSTGLAQGRGFSDEITFNDATQLTLIPSILGTTDDGQRIHECDENRYGYIINLQ